MPHIANSNPDHSNHLAPDTATLLCAVAQLSTELAAVRLEAANLHAAMRAALGAARDGEPDPLAYLRWELAEYDSRGRR